MPKKFIPPIPPEVTEYAATINFKLSGDEFCDFYQAKGWRVGTSPMRDWRAAVRTWKHRQGNCAPQPAAPSVKFAEQRRRQIIEQKQIADYVGRIRAIRTWRGNSKCPFGDPIETERRMLIKIRDNHGQNLIAQVLAKLKGEK